MEAKEFVQRQIAAAHRLIDGVVQDTTDEQLNWMPHKGCQGVKGLPV